MGQELLVEQIKAGDDFIAEFGKRYSVSVYCWINPTESDRWYLYVAADNMGENIRNGYGEVSRILRDGNQWLDPFQIKLIDSSDAIARDAIKIRDRFPIKTIPTRYRGALLGNLGIEAAYIYPLHVSATP